MAMGLLGGFDDPKTLGLLGMAAPLLQAGGYSQTPVSLGQAMGVGLQGGVQGYQQGAQTQQVGKLRAFQMAQMEREARQQEARDAAYRSLLEGNTPMSPGMDAGPTIRNASMTMPSPVAGMNPQQIAMLQAMGPEQGMALLAQQQFAKPQGPIKLGANEELRDPNDPSRVLARGMSPDRTFKVGDTRVIEMGDKKITQEWDGRGWTKLADAPRSTEQRNVQTVTLADGIYALRPDGTRGEKIGDRPDRNEGEGREFTQERNIRSEYTTASKPFEELRQHWTRLNAAHQQKDGPGDIALVYSFMKMLDPTSVVREGEFATAQNAGGVPDQIMQMYNRALQGERLPDNVRDGFLQQGARQFDGIARNQVEVEQRYRQLAQANMLNPERTVPDLFGRIPRPDMSAPFQWGGVQTQPTRTATQPAAPAQRAAVPPGMPALPPGFEVVR